MAKKPTEKQLYKLKNEWLGQFFEILTGKGLTWQSHLLKNKPKKSVT